MTKGFLYIIITFLFFKYNSLSFLWLSCLFINLVVFLFEVDRDSIGQKVLNILEILVCVLTASILDNSQTLYETKGIKMFKVVLSQGPSQENLKRTLNKGSLKN